MISGLLSLVALVPVAFAAVHQVSVGGLKADGTPNLNFWPNNFQAAVGDKVVFTFHVKNHTVTQSSFDLPCSKLKDSYGNLAGFDSGFMPVAASDTKFPTFEIDVKDDKPIWGYCRQLNPPSTHCQSGMVFGINPPSYGNTFDAFLANAKKDRTQNSLLPPTSTSTTSYYAPSSSPSWNSYPATHTIVVGGDAKTVGFTYNPPNITANVGDKVTFVFMQKNHTVTQASFDEPCRPIKDTTWPSVYGFDSGFMPVSPNQTDNFPTFTITVNDTKPIWAYCRQQAANFSHCGVGMVAAINADPNSDHSFSDFQQLAVHQNGTGIVDPFGNLSAPATSAYNSYPGYSSTYQPYYPSATHCEGSGCKIGQNLDATSGGSFTDDDASKLQKLYNLAPVALGLLGAAVVLLVVVLTVGIMVLRRTSKEVLPIRSIQPSYHQVPLNMPSSKLASDGSHEYEQPRYSD